MCSMCTAVAVLWRVTLRNFSSDISARQTIAVFWVPNFVEIAETAAEIEIWQFF